ncbi:MAG: dihydropteroate synthase [Eubacterium sp.]|nr:dihydropteroate synthase [Eubacterium sp.]SEG06849.1 Dihydropteroate synthase [Eubacterium ruminantium]
MNFADRIRKDDKPVLMGILNVTPDSFSDGGKYNDISTALKHVEEMINDGADVIDVGGESTRPGYTYVEAEEEIERVCPVIERIKKEFDIQVSLDTYKASVAKAGLISGADIINDVHGLKWKEENVPFTMADVLKENSAGIILMHNRDNMDYKVFTEDVISDLNESIALAKNAGIADDRIVLDPGIGFAKTLEHNLKLMKELDKICNMGYPVLLGISRKSMIGLTLDLPKDEREEGTIASNVYGLTKGCRIFRVHDVKKNRRALDMTYAIMNS